MWLEKLFNCLTYNVKIQKYVAISLQRRQGCENLEYFTASVGKNS